MKLVPRLALVFVSYAAVLVTVVGLLAYESGRSSLRSAVVSDLQSTVIEKEGALVAWVVEKKADISRIAAAPLLLEYASALIMEVPGSPEAQTAHDQLVREMQPHSGRGEFLTLMILDPQTGQVIAATDPGEEGSFKDKQAYFIQGRLDPFVQNPYYSIVLETTAMTASAPLRAPDERLLAVLAGRLDFAEINAIIDRRTNLHQTDEAYLVNTSHLFVTQPRFVTDSAVPQQGVHTEAVNRCLERNSGVVEADDYRGVPAFVVHHWLPERELCLIVKMDQAEAYAPTQAFGRTVILVSVLALIVAGGLAFLFARSLTQPILALQAGAARFAHGESDMRLPENSRDELGELARGFNRMAQVISENESQLRQHARQLEAANKELEAFSYSVSHDLRAPLRAIDGFSRILMEDYGAQLDEEAQRYLGIVRNNTQQMGLLIDDLLAFARLSRQAISLQTVQPASLVQQSLTTLNVEYADRNVEIVVGDLPTCRGDPILLKQVFVNLLSNALKFTRQRDGARVEVGGREDGPERLYYVKDNGAGFDMKYAGKLFGVFQRLHSMSQFEGTGVGLAIVQRIIHRHGGRVWAEAAVDQGATFYFLLPAPEEVSAPTAPYEPEDFAARARELV